MLVSPSGIIGYSLGELLAGYADGALTGEQAMKMVYYFGKLIMENVDKVGGSMAAVNLSWQEAEACCLDGVFPACHNGTNSVTVSGVEKNVIRICGL
jgi:acyl transferase domain-containing protein